MTIDSLFKSIYHDAISKHFIRLEGVGFWTFEKDVEGVFPFKLFFFFLKSADQSLPVSKGVILFLSSIFPLEQLIKNEERETMG